MKTITVHASHTYPIYVQHGLLAECGTYIRTATKAAALAVITDDTVESLYGAAVVSALRNAGFRVETFVFPTRRSLEVCGNLAAKSMISCVKSSLPVQMPLLL